MIDQREFDTLLKYLNLTASDQDGEALTAMRYANSVLKKHKLQWSGFLSQVFRAGQNDCERPHFEPDVFVGGLAALAGIELKKKDMAFVLSLMGYYLFYGRLSDKQETMFAELVDRVKSESR